jgi:hypothetical protein
MCVDVLNAEDICSHKNLVILQFSIQILQLLLLVVNSALSLIAEETIAKV